MPQCLTCGRPLDEHDRHFRFRLPDPVLELPEREQTPGTWMSHSDANESVMMQVPDAGAFVRCLLPVRLDGGYTVTFGVWLSVHRDDLRAAFQAWWEPEYTDLVLEGRLGNALPVWGLLAAPATAFVLDPDATPYITSSPDVRLADVLARDWPHEDVLNALP